MGLSIFGLFEVDVFTVIIMGVGISLFPLALDALSTFVPIGRSVQRHMSSFLVFVLVVLSLGGLHTYFTVYRPFVLVLIPKSWLMMVKSIGDILAIVLWINVNYSYFRTVFMSFSRRSTNSPSDSDKTTKCKHCGLSKSATMHHCRACGLCIPNMDHHCPFTANCISVGHDGNFHYFYLFLVHLSLGVGYAVLLSTIAFWKCLLSHPNAESPLRMPCIALGKFQLLCVPLFFIWTGVVTLFLFQSFLVFRGQTTLDFLAEFAGKERTRQHKSMLNLKPIYWLFPWMIDLRWGSARLKAS